MIVLLADELDQLFVDAEPPVDAHRPWFCIGLRVVDSDVDFDPSVVRPAELFGDLRAGREGGALNVQPSLVSQPDSLDNKGIALVLANGVAIPKRLRIAGRQRATVGEDV